MTYLLGLDVGTTGAKALLIDVEGTVVVSAIEEYPMFTPHALWAEQDPEDWWKATQRSLRRVLSEADVKPDEVKAIGLTGQMHGLVLLDRDSRVLRPCIMWNDQRTGLQCASITKKVGLHRLLELTGNPVLPGFTASKIVWVRENEPDVYDRSAHVLLPKDYIRYRLTGEHATEVSDASGTSLLDVRHRCWSDEMLSLLNIPKVWMPAVHESTEVTGQVSRAAAEATGLQSGTPVVGGGGDQAAGAVGNGIVRPGVVSVTIGTSGVVFAHTEKLGVEREGRIHAFCHAVPNAWHVMGVTLAAGGSLRWFRDTFGEPERAKASQIGADPYEVLLSEASMVPAGSEGLLFLPYLSGERAPYADPNAKGVFLGLTLRHTKAHCVRAVLEGVAYSLRDCFELMRAMGIHADQVRVSGGGARSPLWRQILSEVFDTELVTLESTEGAPYGAALLAGAGTGIYQSVSEACEQTIRIASRTAPDQVRVRIYQEYFSVYRSMYAPLKPVFDAVSKTVNRLET